MNPFVILLSVVFFIGLWSLVDKAIKSSRIDARAVRSLCRQYLEQQYYSDLLDGRVCVISDYWKSVSGLHVVIDIREADDADLSTSQVFGLGATLIINDGAVTKIIDNNIRHYRRNKS